MKTYPEWHRNYHGHVYIGLMDQLCHTIVSCPSGAYLAVYTFPLHSAMVLGEHSPNPVISFLGRIISRKEK